MDIRRAVDLYVRLYPLLQSTYAELGYPRGYFNDRLIAVIDQLLATPVIEGPIKLELTDVKGPIPSERPWVRYQYADPEPRVAVGRPEDPVAGGAGQRPPPQGQAGRDPRRAAPARHPEIDRAMLDLFPAGTADLAWPLVLALAWVAGELGHRWLNLPRISLYGLVGFLFGHAQLGVLPPAGGGMGMLLANIAFGLILFEFGYRTNLRWLRNNPWLGATGLLEAIVTFVAVYLLARLWGSPNLTALLLASLSMSTSPAAVMRVINEQRSSGQVTERILHLAALNCVLAVFAFKVIVGFWTFESSGNLGLAISSSLLSLAVSAGLGALFGVGVTGLLRRTGRLSQDGTVAFAIAVILLVGRDPCLQGLGAARGADLRPGGAASPRDA